MSERAEVFRDRSSIDRFEISFQRPLEQDRHSPLPVFEPRRLGSTVSDQPSRYHLGSTSFHEDALLELRMSIALWYWFVDVSCRVPRGQRRHPSLQFPKTRGTFIKSEFPNSISPLSQCELREPEIPRLNMDLPNDTKVSTDTFVQWICLSFSGLIASDYLFRKHWVRQRTEGFGGFHEIPL